MNQPGGSGRRYQIETSDAVTERFEHVLRRAIAFGIGAELFEITKQVYVKLQTEPLLFGEALYDLKVTGQNVRMGGIGLLFVTYAVHEASSFVFVRDFRVMIDV